MLVCVLWSWQWWGTCGSAVGARSTRHEAITDFASHSTYKLFLSCISCIAIVFLSFFVFVFVWSHHRLCFPQHIQAFPLVYFLYCNCIFIFVCICICMKPSQTLLPKAHACFSFRVFLILQLYFYLCLYLYLLEAITDFASQSTHKLFLSWISCIVIIFSSLFVIVFVFAWSHHRLRFP